MKMDDPDVLDDNDIFQVNDGYFLPENAASVSAAIAYVNSHTVQHVRQHTWDFENFQKFCLWKPVQAIQNTMTATTQYTRQTMCLPLQRHYISRFPALKVQCLDEDVATDTYFANVAAQDGSTCAQSYVGKVSLLTKAFENYFKRQFRMD